MSVKITYTKGGSDPTIIMWPPNSDAPEQWQFTSGTPLTIQSLLVYPGTLQAFFPDGRQFPQVSPQGSTFTVTYP